ncbi:MAG: cupin domain-containing protein [Hasllibacter sp.]
MGTVLKAARIAAMDGVRKGHFLNPEAVRTGRSLGDAAGLTGIGVHLIEVAPGRDSTEHHAHHHEEEAVFVLSGEGVAVIGDEEVAIGPGDFVGHPRGGPAHHVRATGSAPLRMLVMGQRLAHDVCDYPRAGRRLYRNAGMAWNLVDLAAVEEPEAGRGR